MKPEIKRAEQFPTTFRAPEVIFSVQNTFWIQDERGKCHHFDWHNYFGPTFLRKDGEPRARQPHARNPVWRAFTLWLNQGKKVNSFSKQCIYRKPITKKL